MPRLSSTARSLGMLAAASAILLAGCSSSSSTVEEVTSAGSGAPAATCAEPYAAAVPYDKTKKDYKPCDVVTLDGQDFLAKYIPGVNACPIQADCTSTYDPWAWTSLAQGSGSASATPASKTEFDFYNAYVASDGSKGYPALLAELLDAQQDCTTADYATKPTSNGTMLDCYPKDPTQAPNVKNAMSFITKARFTEYTPTLVQTDSTWNYPVNPAYKTDSYTPFLRSIARFPALCAKADDACARALSSYFAHAGQETGSHDPSVDLLHQEFTALRESGATGQKDFEYNLDGTACVAGLTCPLPYPPAGQAQDPAVNYTGWYYGRGPMQLSYPGNYALFAKEVYGDDKQQFLLNWPDLVAWDPDTYFLSGMWYFMTPQSPKPSMYDVMTGSYSPKATCVAASDCEGIMAASGGGAENPFEATIEIINPIECRPDSTQPAPLNRATAYLLALKAFGSKAVSTESDPAGCDNIRANSKGFEYKTIYTDPNLSY